jgi:hypothetical protein
MNNRFEFLPDESPDDIQGIVDRMARAGWLTGTNIVTKDDFRVQFSELGQRKMKQLCTNFYSAVPDFFKAKDTSALKPGDVSLNPNELLVLLSNITVASQELQPPPITPAESKAFLGFVMVNVKKFCGPPQRA